MTADDLHPGDEIELGSYLPTRAEIVEFASRWDPQPHHIDIEASRGGYFGDVIASGVHTLAIYQRLSVESALARWDVLAGVMLREVRLPAPVRPDRVLTGRIVVLEVDLGHPDRGRVVKEGVLLDPDGREVLRLVDESLIWRRGARR
ncbi:MaoC/PaaZ C-terminal domain-containing protein [Nocardia cerradoensis]|uniref:MaoC/PaaZ C-terminal domain-containing protein n=1 Tax=Nocardia cerradoensis TaxID=85688 RepID=UPI0012F6261A|nr:MaoC/PaaZ C-terminal domain-containing protein [Nocardia cerradoensis]